MTGAGGGAHDEHTDDDLRRIPVVDKEGNCIGMVAQADVAISVNWPAFSSIVICASR